MRRHDRRRFSYRSQRSADSFAEKRDANGAVEMVAGELARTAGACWDSWSAAEGERWLGGWRREGAIVLFTLWTRNGC